MPTQRICPRCGSSNFNRAHRTTLERLLPGLKAFRCGLCNHRFVVLGEPRSQKTATN